MPAIDAGLPVLVAGMARSYNQAFTGINAQRQ